MAGPVAPPSRGEPHAAVDLFVVIVKRRKDNQHDSVHVFGSLYFVLEFWHGNAKRLASTRLWLFSSACTASRSIFVFCFCVRTMSASLWMALDLHLIFVDNCLFVFRFFVFEC